METVDSFRQKLLETANLPSDGPMGLSGSFYTAQELFEFEKSTMLKEGWYCVGREDQVAEPGDFFCDQILDEPIIVVRGDDQKIRALSNVCRHRGMQIAEGAGNTKRFVCSYHAWSYARDGQLARAANMQNSGFDPKNCRLPEFACEIWRGFAYVSISDTPKPLRAQLAQLDDLLAPYESEKFRTVHSAVERWNCNWKCLVENFMEGYHLSVVHPETLRGYTPTELCTKGPSGGAFTSYHANYPDDIPSRGNGAKNLNEKQRHRSSLFCVYPTQVASQSASLLVSLSLRPVAADKIDVRWTMSVYDNDLDDETIASRVALWTEVNREDREKLEKLQIALKSAKALPGPLAGDDFEGTIRGFHGYLAARIGR